MVSSSVYFFVVSVIFLLQFLTATASSLKTTTYIDKLCSMPSIDNKAFCLQTLSDYRPAACATGLLSLAEIVIRDIVICHAKKSASFADEASKKVPNLRTQFKTCEDAYLTIEKSLMSAAFELKESPDTANYDVMVCTDQTTLVKTLVGKNKDNTSKSLMVMTLQMQKLLRLAVGATQVVGG